MEMELDLVLNLINYKFFLEVMKIKGFGNANNQFWNQSKGYIRNKTKTGIQSSFWNQELDNTCRVPKFLVDPLEGPSMRQCGRSWNLEHDPDFQH